MVEVIRICPEEARQKVVGGSALLVCAYDDEQKFVKFRLQDAISLSEFNSRRSLFSQDQEIIFYCA
ncbi:MAG: ArsR family transcriptional regulator [Thermodesulfobacteriota bacterium]|nr:ArsR family transcriptional regulator [Thermodesulfobacteriota bacterium]